MVEVPRTEDFTAEAVEGFVLLDGPGVTRTLPPESAMHLADRLLDAAVAAVAQRAMLGHRYPGSETNHAPNSGPSSSG